MFQLIDRHAHLIRADVPEGHLEKMAAALQQMMGEGVCFEDLGDFNNWVKEALPLIKWGDFSSADCTLTISLLCLNSPHVSLDTLFPEVLKQRLLSGREVSILACNHMCFYHKRLPERAFFIGTATVLLDSFQEWYAAIESLTNLAQEFKTALNVPTRAASLLTKKARCLPTKVSAIQNELHRLIKKFPHAVDASIFEEMDRFFVLASKGFLDPRDTNHITRLITSIYVFRKRLLKSIAQGTEQYCLELRLIPTDLNFPFCVKPVLGCLIGIGQLAQHEILEEKHILSAVRKILPDVDASKSSCYQCEWKEEKSRCFYLELEKQGGGPFTLDEKQRLMRGLKEQLNCCVEKLVPSVFMIRNEEEVFKNILTLRREINFVRDLPQAMISLDRQTETDIIFTVLWVKIGKLKVIQHELKDRFLVCERAQTVGFLRRKHPIEAHVFQLTIPKDASLLRPDLAINFYLAREKATSLLREILGEFRDYNGGIILKQSEMLSELKTTLGTSGHAYLDLIDNFFYSISPIEKQVTLLYDSLKILLDLFLQVVSTGLRNKFCYVMQTQEDPSSVFIVLKFSEISLQKQLALALEAFAPNLVKSEVVTGGVILQSYIYEHVDAQARKNICRVIKETIESTIQNLKKTKTLRVSLPLSLTSLDPRMAGDESTGNILRVLFEGLTRIGRDGQFELGMAESIVVSPDKRQYTFKLRKAQWSNSSPVLAYDFEYAWKKILSPSFKTSYAYLFYPIKNAKKAKEGRCSLDDVGVKAVDPRTLVVELDFPAPYFLELTAHTIYSPVHHQMDVAQPNWPSQEKDDYVCNGGFTLKTQLQHQYYELEKNPYYWDADQIEIDNITIHRATYHVAYQMFKKGEIDWIGNPFGPWDPTFKQEGHDRLIRSSHIGVYGYTFNTQRFPFHHVKLRRAFALAVNRDQVIQSFSALARPAYSPLVSTKGYHFGSQLEENLESAQQLFEQALQELGLTRKTFPILTLPYIQGGLRDIAAKQVKDQWEKAFGIQCDLVPLDYWHVAMQKMQRGEFHIGGLLWRSLVSDPIYMLNCFRHTVDQTNLSGWEASEYRKILELADGELNPEQRALYMGQAHDMLIREVPTIPICYLDVNMLVKSHVVPSCVLPFGVLDVKWTKFV